METSFKRLYGKEANFSHLKIIGARAFVHIKDAKKLEPKSWQRMLCGFSKDEALSYRVWNPKIRRVVESRYVTFIETPISCSATYTTLSAPGVAASGIDRRLRFNRCSAAGCTGLNRGS